MNRKQAVIFDLDGTLIDNRASFAKAYQVLCALRPELYASDDSETEEWLVRFYRAYNSPRKDECYRALTERLAPRTLPSQTELIEEWGIIYAQNAVRLPDAIDTLEYLKARGYRIGLLTNGDSERQWAKIHSSDLFPYFDHITVSGDCPFAKPDPSIYRISLEGLGITADQALFVGDTPSTDIDGARNAGIDSLWLTNGTENTVGATYIAPSVSYLKEIL